MKSGSPSLCWHFCTDKEPALTETFIAAQLQGLEPGGHVLAGAGKLSSADGKLRLSRWKGVQNAVSEYLIGTSTAGYEEALVKYWQETRPELIFAQYGPTGARVFPAARELSLPLWIHFHGYDVSRRDVLRRYRKVYPAMLAYAQGIVAVSDKMVEALVALGAPRNRIYKVPYSVEIPAECPAGLAERGQLIVQVGRLVSKKDPLLTLNAFAEIAGEFPQAKLAFAGDGPLRGALEKQVRAKGLASRVVFSGAIVADEVKGLLSQAYMFVLPSRMAADGNSEGLPVSILEAMAAGLPVISTRHAGIPEAIDDGVHGLLIEPGDKAGLVAAMRRLFKEPVFAVELGKNGWSRAGKEYSRGKQMKILRELLGGRGRY